MATLTEMTDIDFKKEGPWTPLTPGEDGLGAGCEVTLRIGEGCNEAAREYRWVAGAKRAFHNREAEMLPVAGVDTELFFTPLATITLEAGDDAALKELVYREPKYFFDPAAGAPNRFEMTKENWK